MQSLCTLRDHCRQWPRNTRYQADATPYLGRTSTGWIAPALPGALTRSPRRRGRAATVVIELSALARSRFDEITMLHWMWRLVPQNLRRSLASGCPIGIDMPCRIDTLTARCSRWRQPGDLADSQWTWPVDASRAHAPWPPPSRLHRTPQRVCRTADASAARFAIRVVRWLHRVL